MTSESHVEHDHFVLSDTSRSAWLGLLPVEAQIPLSVNGVEWLTFHCTPLDLPELSTGYLYNEAFIANSEEIKALTINEKPHIDIWLDHGIERPEKWHRTSGCQGGMLVSDKPIERLVIYKPYPLNTLHEMVSKFHEGLSKTDPGLRGLHTSALYAGNEMIKRYSDIGRHNTLDKIAGWIVRQGLRLTSPLVITTGRLTEEMVTKCTRMGVPAVISLHSATSLAVQAAEKVGMLLAGQAKHRRLEIFTQPETIP